MRDTDHVELLTRQKLPGVIAEAGKVYSSVSLYGAHDNDSLVIDNRPSGWVVFFTERGGESRLKTHASEHEACLDVLERLGIRG